MGISSQIDPILKAIFHHLGGRAFDPQLLPSTCLNHSKTSDCKEASEERFCGLNRIKTSPLSAGLRIRGGKGRCWKSVFKTPNLGGDLHRRPCAYLDVTAVSAGCSEQQGGLSWVLRPCGREGPSRGRLCDGVRV